MKILTYAFCVFLYIGSFSKAASGTCIPEHVGEIQQRVHIRCEKAIMDGANTIFYIAVPTTGTLEQIQHANRLLSIGMAALASGKSINISFIDGDVSGASYGCGATDCRKPVSFFIMK